LRLVIIRFKQVSETAPGTVASTNATHYHSTEFPSMLGGVICAELTLSALGWLVSILLRHFRCIMWPQRDSDTTMSLPSAHCSLRSHKHTGQHSSCHTGPSTTRTYCEITSLAASTPENGAKIRQRFKYPYKRFLHERSSLT